MLNVMAQYYQVWTRNRNSETRLVKLKFQLGSENNTRQTLSGLYSVRDQAKEQMSEKQEGLQAGIDYYWNSTFEKTTRQSSIEWKHWYTTVLIESGNVWKWVKEVMGGSDETTEELLHSTRGELIEMWNQKLVNVVTELCWLNVQKVDVQQKVTNLCPAFACDSRYKFSI